MEVFALALCNFPANLYSKCLMTQPSAAAALQGGNHAIENHIQNLLQALKWEGMTGK